MCAISIDDAQATVLGSVRPLAAETVPIERARGRVLAEDVRAAADVPARANSAMDGFAVQAGPGGRTLRIVGESRAGAPATVAVAVGEAVRISTGALVPEGADAVVPVEHTRPGDDGLVVLDEPPAKPGANVRLAGEDMRAGEAVLGRGRRLDAIDLAIAVTAGRAELLCSVRPRVALAVSGDELRPAGATLRPGEVHESNATALRALAAGDGAIVAESTTRLPDDLASTVATLGDSLKQADVLIVTGGVSVGRHDHVKPALRGLGAEERFWRVAMRPGGPIWFGTRDGALVFALPGNPVSAIVTYLLFARPALAALQGADPAPEALWATLDEDVRRRGEKDEAVRVTIGQREDGAHVVLSGPQGSHQISALADADALLIVEAGAGAVPAGTRVRVRPIGR